MECGLLMTEMPKGQPIPHPVPPPYKGLFYLKKLKQTTTTNYAEQAGRQAGRQGCHDTNTLPIIDILII